MLVTFGRLATSELRERVRERLVSPSARCANGHAGPPTSCRYLAAEHGRRVVRAQRLRGARGVRRGDHHHDARLLPADAHVAGLAGDVDADARLVPDIATWRPRWSTTSTCRRVHGSPEPLYRAGRAHVAHEAISDPHAQRSNRPTRRPSGPGTRTASPGRPPRRSLRRKRVRRVLDYDDLLVLLRDAWPTRRPARRRGTGPRALPDRHGRRVPGHRPGAVAHPAAAFHGHRTLVLIGDPKQAIYAFRGADVATYLAARRDADATPTLGTQLAQRRPLLQGLGRPVGGAALGDPASSCTVEAARTGRGWTAGRRCGSVRSPANRSGSREAGARGGRCAAARRFRRRGRRGAPAPAGRLLGPDGEWRALRPGDIAVLAQRNADAATVRDAGLPAPVPDLRLHAADRRSGPVGQPDGRRRSDPSGDRAVRPPAGDSAHHRFARAEVRQVRGQWQ